MEQQQEENEGASAAALSASAPPDAAAADAGAVSQQRQEEEEDDDAAQQQHERQQQQRAKAKKRTGTSKYDFVKVRVRLDTPLDDGGGGNSGAAPSTSSATPSSSSSYVLSRYLVARMLAVARVPYVKAVKCALELKKRLVDAGVVELPQRELERRLFALLQEKGFGPDVVGSYRLAASFYGARAPLVVALAGAPWTGKTALAQQLAARLNAPNVVATDAVRAALGAAAWASASAAQAAAAGAEAASSGGNKTPRAAAAAAAASSASALAAACAGAGAGLAPVPLWARADLAPPPPHNDAPSTSTSASAAERRLCEAWRDECRAVRRALAGDLSRALSDGRPLLLEGASLDPAALARDLGRAGVAVMLPKAGAKGSDGGATAAAAAAAATASESAAGPPPPPPPPPPPLPRVRPTPAGAPRPIFIPVIIAMDEPDHRLMAEDALARRQQKQPQHEGADEAAAFWRARALQAHLASYERQGLPVLRVRYGAFTEAVDALHDYALRCIRLSFRV